VALTHAVPRSGPLARPLLRTVNVLLAVSIVIMAALAAAAPPTRRDAAVTGTIEVIVHEQPDAGSGVRDYISGLGGSLGIDTIHDGYVALMPTGTVGSLALHPGVRAVVLPSDLL